MSRYNVPLYCRLERSVAEPTQLLAVPALVVPILATSTYSNKIKHSKQLIFLNFILDFKYPDLIQ